jgi:hypothetical protein
MGMGMKIEKLEGWLSGEVEKADEHTLGSHDGSKS